jgi:hypothetical protein
MRLSKVVKVETPKAIECESAMRTHRRAFAALVPGIVLSGGGIPYIEFEPLRLPYW